MPLFTRDGYSDTCGGCEGDGRQRDWCAPGKAYFAHACTDCLGTGVRLTDIGRELVDLLTNAFDLKLKSK